MGSFGENLRREREMRGVTLEEIAESTKISTRLLRALELEHFSDLPGGVFTRSFIRHYADYLGLDSELVLAEYRQVAPGNEYDLNRLSAGTSFSTKPASRGSAIPWVVAAILLGGGYATYRYAHRPIEASLPAIVAPATSSSTPASTASSPGEPDSGSTKRPAPSENTSPPASEPAIHSAEAASPAGGGNSPVPAESAATGDAATGTQSAAGQEAASSSKTATSAPGPNATAGAPVLGDGDLVLKVTTTEDAWLAVAADGKTLMQRILPANSVRVFRANDAFDVTTGNAEGTTLTLNGEPQKPLGRHGEFRKVHLTRDGVQSAAKPANPSN